MNFFKGSFEYYSIYSWILRHFLDTPLVSFQELFYRSSWGFLQNFLPGNGFIQTFLRGYSQQCFLRFSQQFLYKLLQNLSLSIFQCFFLWIPTENTPVRSSFISKISSKIWFYVFGYFLKNFSMICNCFSRFFFSYNCTSVV